MRFLWILEGDEPNIDKARGLGINGFYFDVREEKTTQARLKRFRGLGFATGIYVAWNWAGWGETPEKLATMMIERTKELTDGSNDFPRVQFDIEAHDPAYVETCIRTWRRVYPWRATSWTLEGMQGGWMDAEFVRFLNTRHIRVSPQPYYGDMTPIAQDAVYNDLHSRGIKAISLMYDAAHLPAAWDGFAFHQGRLP